MAELEQKSFWNRVDKLQLGLGLFVFLFSTIVYLMTVQRSIPFWDCGEFIACSYILGIPHPPGAPLWVLIGRIFSILPIASDISHRINLISVFSTAAASLFGFLIIVRLVRDWFGAEMTQLRKVGMYAGAVIGALLMSFSNTNWGSAVEAEVYGVSMLMMMALIWLTLQWAEKRLSAEGDKYLIYIFFLGVLSTAVHLTVYLIMPFVALAIFLLDERLRRNPLFWITMIILMLPVKSLIWFMYAGAAWTIVLLLIFLSRSARRTAQLPMLIMVASGIALSAQFYIMVRAAERPAINENAPQTWSTFEDFLERKQYGSMSMVERMFTRRGSWANQFGTHPRMGFWGFFQEQYGIGGKTFLITVFPLGLLGMFEIVVRRWRNGLPIFFMILAATVGLVLYMNFADGTKPFAIPGDEAALEVRDRDYFWQPGFILFGMAIGLGFVALWEVVRQFAERRGFPQAVYALLALLWLPIQALQANYYRNDRSDNYIAYDYAHNLLISADSNAVVFTNGDNDTFPVWCLQEVYGFRKDVRIANLSLLNTNWYIKQLKNEMNVPISLTDAQIDALLPMRMQDGRIVRIQDMLIDNILETNRWNVPVHFAATVSQENQVYRGQSLDQNLELKGMMYRVKREKEFNMVDLETTYDLYMNRFSYRGVADTEIFKDENAARLTNNYAAGFLFGAEELRKRGEYDRAKSMVDKSLEVVPSEWRTRVYLAQLYADMDSLHRVDEILSQPNPNYSPEEIWVTIAQDYYRLGRPQKAYDILKRKLAESMTYSQLNRQLLSFYYRDSLYDSMEVALNRWLAVNPSDTEAQEALRDVRQLQHESGVRVRQVDVPGNSR